MKNTIVAVLAVLSVACGNPPQATTPCGVTIHNFYHDVENWTKYDAVMVENEAYLFIQEEAGDMIDADDWCDQLGGFSLNLKRESDERGLWTEPLTADGKNTRVYGLTVPLPFVDDMYVGRATMQGVFRQSVYDSSYFHETLHVYQGWFEETEKHEGDWLVDGGFYDLIRQFQLKMYRKYVLPTYQK